MEDLDNAAEFMLGIIMITVIDNNDCGDVDMSKTSEIVSGNHARQLGQRLSRDTAYGDNHNY